MKFAATIAFAALALFSRSASAQIDPIFTPDSVADVKTRAPIDPDKTLFRPGSVSKLFVWTAVVQLADAGKLDLDEDVNAYLDFKLPERFAGPVTMRQLMTHTAGFEEFFRPLLLGDPDKIDPLDRTAKETLPALVFAPGEVPACSNYGAALADLIFLAGFPLAFLVLSDTLATHTARIDWLFRGLQVVGLIGIPATPIPMLELVTDRRPAGRGRAGDHLVRLQPASAEPRDEILAFRIPRKTRS